MVKVNDGLKPAGMTPIVTGQEDRGLKPPPLTPVQPEPPASSPALPAHTPKK